MTEDERESYGALLERQAMEWQPPLIALSLSYHLPVSVGRIRADLSRLHTHIDRDILGSHFYKRRAHQRSQFWAVIESMTSVRHVLGPAHRHVHAAWKMPPPFGIDDFCRVMDKQDRQGKTLWLRFAPHGTYDTQVFRFRSESEIGWGFYSTKYLTEPDNILYSADFLRR